MSEPVFETIAIIGTGLIGASIARAARQYEAASAIRLFDADKTVLAKAGALGLGETAPDLARAAFSADCVFLCVPVGAMSALAADITPHMKPGAILTDVGSVKGEVVRAFETLQAPHIHPIPGHPIAGTEQSGPDAGFAQLFRGAWHILTPLPNPYEDYKEAQELLTDFWQALGARVSLMDAARHDRVLAITSHLPHLIAYNIVSTAYDMESIGEGEVVKYSAGGFRDFTRIAASDPVMWRDVFLSNKEAVLEVLGRFSEDLAALQRAIRWGDGDALMREFTRARGIRQMIIDAGLESDEVNFGRNTAQEDSE